MPVGTKNKDLKNPLLKETFIFRPLYLPGEGMLRYAEGKWIPDDGKPDMAFVHHIDYPVAEFVSLPYYTNLLWTWGGTIDSRRLWHYFTTNNNYWYDYYYYGRENHPNEVACGSAMDKCSNLHGCANGHRIEIAEDNDYIKQGKLIIKSTGKPVVKPTNPVCFLCLNNKYGHRLEAIEHEKSEWGRKRQDCQDHIEKVVSDQRDYEETLKFANEHLADLEDKITELRKEDKNARN